MSTTIQSCPGCKSLILADTYECPECGCVLDQKRKDAANERTASELKSATLTERCPHCREEVRIGLVRCWNCSGFMRDDIAKRYHNMTTTPQPIIYSDVPPEERTDFIPARSESDSGDRHTGVFDAEDDGFSLDDDLTSGGDDTTGFELDSAAPAQRRQPPAASASAAPAADAPAKQEPARDAEPGPDQPQSKTPGAAANVSAPEKTAQPADDGSDSATDTRDADKRDAPKVDADELLSIAMQEQREIRRRRSQRMAEDRAKRMLIPCQCGAWVRVHERQAGRTVRCRQCKQPINIPFIRRKAEKGQSETQESAPAVTCVWLDDIRIHTLNPTSLVLKPGSLAEDHRVADVAFIGDRVAFVSPAGDTAKKKKRGLFGSFGAKKGNDDLSEWRNAVRSHVSGGADLAAAPQADVQLVDKEHLGELRLVQPIVKVQASMFAGIPVFGEGRIAVFIPVQLAEDRQQFCSMTLTAFRRFQEQLEAIGGPKLPAQENGVPQTERHESMTCHYTQKTVDAVRDLPYYQQDDAFELTLTGYQCANCQIAVSEEGRKQNKLGGAAGKGLARAKCPKCGGKFGNVPLYKVTRKSDASADAEA